MGIKNVRTATYIADTGKEYQLDEMASSHILNVIAHHQKQVYALNQFPLLTNLPEQENIDARKANLLDTINELYRELATRHPDKDEEVPAARGFRDGGY